MFEEIVVYVALLIALTLWLAVRHALGAHHAERQHRIVRAGESCAGVVVGVQRPFILDPYTRFYFEFVPPGAAEPLRACHVDRRIDAPYGLPSSGASVMVRYLPEHPEQAVIARLVELPRQHSLA